MRENENHNTIKMSCLLFLYASGGFFDDNIARTTNTKPHLNDRMCTVIRLVVTANCQNGMNVSSRISTLCFFPSTNGLWCRCWCCDDAYYYVWSSKPNRIVVASLYLSPSLLQHLPPTLYFPTSSGLTFNGKSFATKVANRETYKRNRLASSTGSGEFQSKLYCLPIR